MASTDRRTDVSTKPQPYDLANAAPSSVATALSSQHLQVHGESVPRRRRQIELVADQDHRHGRHAERIQDLVTDRRQHVERRPPSERVDEHEAVQRRGLARRQGAVLVLACRVVHLQREVLAADDQALGE